MYRTMCNLWLFLKKVQFPLLMLRQMHPIKSISQCLIVVKEKQLFSQVTKVKAFTYGN